MSKVFPKDKRKRSRTSSGEGSNVSRLKIPALGCKSLKFCNNWCASRRDEYFYRYVDAASSDCDVISCCAVVFKLSGGGQFGHVL